MPALPRPTPTLGTVQKLTDQRFLNLFTVDVRSDGKSRPWTFASRHAAPLSGNTRATADAVVMVILVPSTGVTSPDATTIPSTLATNGTDEPRLLLIREFRPALGGFQRALPAGLIDDGEDAPTAAARELHEETGLTLTRVVHVSPPVASSAGLTDETVVYVYGEAEGSLSDAFLETHEHIAAQLFTLDELRALVSAPGADIFSARLYAVLAGFFAAGRLTLDGLGPASPKT